MSQKYKFFPYKTWDEQANGLTKKELQNLKTNAGAVVKEIERLMGEVGAKSERHLPYAGELVKKAKNALSEINATDKPGEILRLNRLINSILADMHRIIKPRKTFTPLTQSIYKG